MASTNEYKASCRPVPGFGGDGQSAIISFADGWAGNEAPNLDLRFVIALLTNGMTSYRYGGRNCYHGLFAWCLMVVSGRILFAGAFAPHRQQPRGSSSSLSAQVDKELQESIKLVILPGFGNYDQDYFLEQAPQGSLVGSLQKRGWTQVEVLPVKSRLDWLKVFLYGLLDIDFWKGTLHPAENRAFGWYLQLVEDAVCSTADDRHCVLVCHSAGGWLARAAIGYSDRTRSKVRGLVTLGAPHLPPPPEVMDMTRGALKQTHQDFPDAYYASSNSDSPKDDIFYITVMGEAVRGKFQERSSPFEPTSVQGFAYNSYEAVSGVGESVGDGVVPLSHGHLVGATQMTLEGVVHSINAPDQWYGTNTILDRWHDSMLEVLLKQPQIWKESRVEEP